jgi:hypothetical protein
MKKELTIGEAINTTMIALAVIAFFMQIPIDDSSVNIATACIALIGSMCALAYFRYTDAFQTHPLSTFAIFGYCATTQYGALLVQSATFSSLSQNLRQPIETFSVLLLYLVVAIAAHMSFRYFSPSGSQRENSWISGGLRRLLEKLNVYVIPHVYVLWCLGLIGLIAVLSSRGAGPDSEGIASKISQGISYLAWAPFLIPIFVAHIGRQYCNTKLHYSLLIGFSVLLALIGIAANARSMIVSGATTMALIMLLLGMRSKLIARPKQIYQAAALLVLGVILLIPVSDLATAMVIAREHRTTSGALQMVNYTIDALMSPTAIDTQRKKEKLGAIFSPYDEYYIQNPVLARFVQTKFHDNALYFAGRLTERGEEELADTTIDLTWALLPDPVLKFFDIKVINKKSLRFTIGDYLYHQAAGGSLGGYLMGSNLAHGIGLFGWFFPIIYFFMCWFTYWVLEFLVSTNKKGEVIVSVVGSLLIWRLFFNGITAESVIGSVAFVFREVPQSIFIFFIAYQVARLMSYVFVLADQLHPPRAISGKAK